MTTDTNPLPLAGIRIIEMGHTVMGPSCSVVLADLGADVIKVEPPEGERTRHNGGLVADFKNGHDTLLGARFFRWVGFGVGVHLHNFQRTDITIQMKNHTALGRDAMFNETKGYSWETFKKQAEDLLPKLFDAYPQEHSLSVKRQRPWPTS